MSKQSTTDKQVVEALLASNPAFMDDDYALYEAYLAKRRYRIESLTVRELHSMIRLDNVAPISTVARVARAYEAAQKKKAAASKKKAAAKKKAPAKKKATAKKKK